jgi:hypothetical protein
MRAPQPPYSAYGSCNSRDPTISGTVQPDSTTTVPLSMPYVSYRTLRFSVAAGVSAIRIVQNMSTPVYARIMFSLSATGDPATWAWQPDEFVALGTCLGPTTAGQEVDLVLANSANVTSAGTISIVASNIGCVGWAGTVDGKYSLVRADGATFHETWHA